MTIKIIVAALSLIVWLFLLRFWGDFWRADRRIENSSTILTDYPTVWAIVPARDEAEVISVLV